MKTCPYCGKQYPDDVELCPLDQHPVEGARPPIIQLPAAKRVEPARRFVLRIGLPVVAGGLLVFILIRSALWGVGYWFFERPVQEKVKSGKVIVRAIEDFRKERGRYPTQWTEFVPKYLPAMTNGFSEPDQFEFFKWSYRAMTNDGAVSYKLFYYRGHGGIGYDPPVWYEEFDGNRRTIRSGD